MLSFQYRGLDWSVLSQFWPPGLTFDTPGLGSSWNSLTGLLT